MKSPLLCVDFVLQSREETSPGLQVVGLLIADFLGPGRCLSLHEACHYGSTKLLDWIWHTGSSSPASCNASNWSLSCLLQSELQYYHWQFSEALEVAGARGDFETVKWLLQHFQHCQVAVEVVEAAARNGQLEILHFLWEQDAGESREGSALTHVVHWGGRSLVEAVENGHPDVARWLYQHSPCGYGEADTTNAIKTALRGGDMKLAEFLLPRGKLLLDYAEFCAHPDVVEWKLDCGYLQRDVFGSAVAMTYLVRSGRLDLMKRIAAQHDPPPDDSDWKTDWRCAMVHACVYGNQAILQWLMEHPAGRWTCDGDDRLYSELVFSAAYKGNVEVMKYLFERGTVDKVRDALLHAIREGHLDTVKWLIEHFPESEQIPEYCVLDETARYGHLEMLEYFQALQPSTVPGYLPVTMSLSPRAVRNSRGEKFQSETIVPASDDYLKVHQMLCRYRTEWHPTEAMDDAAANGHLEVVKWLHLNRSEGCTTAAMDCAAANGHLDVVQWLHTHRAEGCTTKAMDGAAENGHLDVIKWLDRNRFEGCTRKAIEEALSNGHLRVANWLHAQLPSLIPTNVELWRRPRDLFELLLFQCFHFSCSFSPGLVQYAKEILLDASSKSNHKHIVDWLQKKYPAAPGTREEEEQW